MNIGVKACLAAGLVAGALGFGGVSAQAMPIGLSPDVAAQVDGLKPETVRWVCGPYGCRWVPNRRYFAPRLVRPWRGYGYGRPYGFYGRPGPNWRGGGYRRW